MLAWCMACCGGLWWAVVGCYRQCFGESVSPRAYVTVSGMPYRRAAVLMCPALPLLQVGRAQGACPFYVSRDMMGEADIIFMPYNYLLDMRTRKTIENIRWAAGSGADGPAAEAGAGTGAGSWQLGLALALAAGAGAGTCAGSGWELGAWLRAAVVGDDRLAGGAGWWWRLWVYKSNWLGVQGLAPVWVELDPALCPMPPSGGRTQW
jgi:hypothetical protein